jgi:ArsR family transcriptional regulator
MRRDERDASERRSPVASLAARAAQALAHPIRLQIIELLRDEGAYVMHLTNALNRRQAYLSQHLAVLREAGLVVCERRGMTVIYRVSDPGVFELLEHLRRLAPALEGVRSKVGERVSFSPGGLSLRTMRGCRCPRCCGRE